MKDFKKLTVKSVNKDFGNKRALNNFSLSLDKGEFVTFLGPSGCGKSTALNCISGLIPITSGEVFIDNECIDDSVKKIAPEKREFGMVFQNYALFPHLNVYQNVAFGLQLKKDPKQLIKEKVEKILKLVHLEGYEEKFPSQMSGGEQQRVAIARCVVLEPRLLMLDEPLSNLDAKLRVDMRYELKALHERLKITIIYVTHDQQEALALSDKIVVMKKGIIQQIGTPSEIYSRPSNLFVADFMGFKNIWPAKITDIKKHGENMEITVDVNGSTFISKDKFSKSDADQKRSKGIVDAFDNKKEVFTAIRPEDILLGESAINKISAKVSIVEYLGQDTLVSSMHKNQRIDMRTESKISENEKITLYIPTDKLLIFPKQEEV